MSPRKFIQAEKASLLTKILDWLMAPVIDRRLAYHRTCVYRERSGGTFPEEIAKPSTVKPKTLDTLK